MDFKIKNLSDAAAKNIRSIGKYKNYDKYKKRNHILMEDVYNTLIFNEIDYIVHDDGKFFHCIHRSNRDDVLVQHSHGVYKNGELLATYHDNINSFDDLKNKGYTSGIWSAVKVA